MAAEQRGTKQELIGPWAELALIEWRRAFRGVGGGAGRRDFLWLTVLLFLTVMLALLLWSSREGLLNQFVNVSLGYLEGSGVPVWVVAEIDIEGSETIDRELMDMVRSANDKELTIFPYREVEENLIRLPGTAVGTKIWKREEIVTWAVAAGDPLWEVPLADDADTAGGRLPLRVVLNIGQFAKNFDCDVYLEETRGLQAPRREPAGDPALVEQLRQRVPCLADGFLWLEIQVRKRWKTLPFEIVPLRRIATMQDVDLLVPLSTFSAAKVSGYYPDLRYSPEDPAGEVRHLTALRLRSVGGKLPSEESLRLFRQCLGLGDGKPGNRMVLNPPQLAEKVRSCGTQAGTPLQQENDPTPKVPFLTVAQLEVADAIDYDPADYLLVPCDRLARSAEDHLSGCEDGGSEGRGRLDLVSLMEGYPKALVYTERERLDETVELLSQLQRPAVWGEPGKMRRALYIHPTYQSALVRFGFIDRIVGLLARSYGVFFVAFLVVLLWVQLGVVVGHRRHQYGVYLAKGMAWTQIRKMVLLQVTVSFAAAFAVALVAMGALSAWLSYGVSKVLHAEGFADHISGDLVLLPLPLGDCLLVGGMSLAISLAMAALLLVVIIGRKVEPAELLHT